MRFAHYCFSICFLLFSPTTSAQKFWQLKYDLNKLASLSNAEVGIAVIINSKDTIVINNQTEYPLMSVFKLHQSLAIAHTLEQQQISLDTLLSINRSELRKDTYSPLRDKYSKDYFSITIKELLRYTLLLSDNNACDILFHRILGTRETKAFIQTLTNAPFDIIATEEEMHRDTQLCYKNWSSPLAAVQLLEELLYNKAIGETYQSFIINTMIQCKTGRNRIPAFNCPKGTIIGHKTGTSDKNTHGEIIGVNDIGFVILPDGQHYTLAIFIKDSKETLSKSEQIISTASQLVYTHISNKITSNP